MFIFKKTKQKTSQDARLARRPAGVDLLRQRRSAEKWCLTRALAPSSSNNDALVTGWTCVNFWGVGGEEEKPFCVISDAPGHQK